MKTNLKTGDIIYTHIPFVWYKPLRYISLAIRKILNTWYNHIAIIVVIWGKVYVAESTKGGVKITPINKWIKDYKVIINRPTIILNEKEIGYRIMKYQGFTGYDYTSLIWYQLILQIFGKWKGKEKNKAAKKLYCSEYVALIYKEHFPKWWLITPKDLYNDLPQTQIYRGNKKELLK
jgi:hypothetical protein